MKQVRGVLVFSLLIAIVSSVSSSMAQTVQQTFVFGGGSNVQFSNDQKIMLEAASKLVQNDFANAENLYTQAIAINGSNIEAYLQRAVVRREMHTDNGMASDANTVIALANNALQQNPNDPNLYYQRGMGYRLLRQFDQARDDITNGMRIGGKDNWKTDLKAIELERKTAK
jgi:Tfp pilus assembly protein PilF